MNLAFANRGNQATYSGTGVIATITMKAKNDFTAGRKGNGSESGNADWTGVRSD